MKTILERLHCYKGFIYPVYSSLNLCCLGSRLGPSRVSQSWVEQFSVYICEPLPGRQRVLKPVFVLYTAPWPGSVHLCAGASQWDACLRFTNNASTVVVLIVNLYWDQV